MSGKWLSGSGPRNKIIREARNSKHAPKQPAPRTPKRASRARTRK